MFGFFNRFSDILAGVATSGIVLITVLAVFMRWLLNSPLIWGEEVLIICYIWLIMLGAASAMRLRMHVSIDALTAMLPEKLQLICTIFTHIISIIALSTFGYLGYELSLIAEDKITPILGVSYLYIDFAVPTGAGLMVIFCLQHLWQDIKRMKNREVACQ
ncbi:TRAP transporter small permease [Citrobacter amalonaticus]|uniref:TRAP transporter small permease protein n=1 Tax=Citrobacter amalonaticus TaxID=35703 RepID=A0A2S4RXF0_CITAM|nr:TRAP transporter small permease [Citrobacter amalonaticus]POT56097.1 TRAP transporter small permease [Citrobacter amalonaticus]POT74406.1 TRAP transporter small permease [Citrobacter amalonaticus]POU65206.1 TRAP transporter small permease [Citrobacter amalonaticus]POV04040.1 TRAP transporter small permease [Citrobacter amalonaticus]